MVGRLFARSIGPGAEESPVFNSPHRRYNALTGDWALTSAQRTGRPWLGSEEAQSPIVRPAFDPTCFLCPGNQRASGAITDDYTGTYVFTNDFAALQDTPNAARIDDRLLVAVEETGTCRVICYSERHDMDMGSMSADQLGAVINLWIEQYRELSDTHTWVQIFENRGAAAGASNPHPHGQIWASSTLPMEPSKEDLRQREYYEAHQSLLLTDYAAQEHDGERVVLESGDWIAIVPFWAVWPFETLVIPRTPTPSLADISDDQRTDLASLLGSLIRAYDRIFDTPFPYSMGWHGAPSGLGNQSHWQLHAHFYPPLLRSASIRKFMVGYELLAEPQRDITAEDAAERIRSCLVADSKT